MASGYYNPQALKRKQSSKRKTAASKQGKARRAATSRKSTAARARAKASPVGSPASRRRQSTAVKFAGTKFTNK